MGDERTWTIKMNEAGRCPHCGSGVRYIDGPPTGAESVEVCPLSRAEAVERERGRLREALRFYADEDNWTLRFVALMMADSGSRARAALSGGATREEQT